MIPLKDDTPSRTTPFVTWLLIAICSVAFLGQLAGQRDGRDSLIERYGMIPARVFDPRSELLIEEAVVVRTPFGREVRRIERPIEAATISPWWTLLSCIFLHGGWLHFLGNMWFLFIFGDNVEDRFGHAGFLVFYLLAGVGASVFHLVTNAGSSVPTIGASGAIAGVMGAYLLLYPHARVLTLVPIVFFMQLIVVPAGIFLGLWFALQLFQGAIAIGSTQAGGVAWWAHVGGFVVGVAASWALRRVDWLQREPDHLVFTPRRIGRYGRRSSFET